MESQFWRILFFPHGTYRTEPFELVFSGVDVWRAYLGELLFAHNCSMESVDACMRERAAIDVVGEEQETRGDTEWSGVGVFFLYNGRGELYIDILIQCLRYCAGHRNQEFLLGTEAVGGRGGGRRIPAVYTRYLFTVYLVQHYSVKNDMILKTLHE